MNREWIIAELSDNLVVWSRHIGMRPGVDVLEHEFRVNDKFVNDGFELRVVYPAQYKAYREWLNRTPAQLRFERADASPAQ